MDRAEGGFAHWPLRLRKAAGPQCECARLDHFRDGTAQMFGFDVEDCLNSTSPLSTGLTQRSRGEHLCRPLFAGWQFWRRSAGPSLCRALPERPCLIGAEILVSVVHQSVEQPSCRLSANSCSAIHSSKSCHSNRCCCESPCWCRKPGQRSASAVATVFGSCDSLSVRLRTQRTKMCQST
jgi:hypothetical protein